MAERQMATELSGIRADHRFRYEWAARRMPKGATVIDAGCGCGYGSAILAAAGLHVIAIDAAEVAIEHATKHFHHPFIRYCNDDLMSDFQLPIADAVIAFEIIEHVIDGQALIEKFATCSNRLVASVPNEKSIPFHPDRFPFHHRHYTPQQFKDALLAVGFRPTFTGRQRNAIETVAHYPAEQFDSMLGRTIVVDASKGM